MYRLLKIILILSYFFSIANAANVWETLVSCIQNPCNCDTPNYYESWNGEYLDKGHRNPLCPPFAKTEGRSDHICLAGSPLPKARSFHHQHICAEETAESDYFIPKIRVRGQFCNAFACWTKVKTLDYNGQCITWPGSYGLPLVRMCARVALPANVEDGTSADLGYTLGTHLNFEGVTVDDEIVKDEYGNVIPIIQPKLCVYFDPAFMDPKTLELDMFDVNPLKQPMHKTTEVHPIVKVLIFLIDTAIQTAASPNKMIGSMISSANTDESSSGGRAAKFFGDLFTHLSFVFEVAADLLISMLEEVGQLNKVVSSNNYGCVTLPIGPFPPPCCQDIPTQIQKPTLQKICQITEFGQPVDSVDGSECLVSRVKNSAISNSARIGFNKILPLCKGHEDPMKTDKCVEIKNLGSFPSASILHASTAKLDIIKKCDNASSGEPCIQSKNEPACHVSENGCNAGFRVIYGSMFNNKVYPNQYFLNDLHDCGMGDHIVCQTIWGVNIGEFVDVSLTFSSIHNQYDIEPLDTMFSLYDPSGMEHIISANIVKQEVIKNNSFTQSPDQLCIFENGDVISCVQRAALNKFIVKSCNGTNCSSNAKDPEFEVVTTDGDNNISAIAKVISTESYDNENPMIIDNIITIAGYNFDSFITDKQFLIKPFTGQNALNSISIHGKYKDNEAPFTVDENNLVTGNDAASYISGLEYVNGYYHRGGNYLCLRPQNLESCPVDITQCVLSKLENINKVNCSDFFNESVKYLGFKLCSVDEENDSTCTNVATIASKTNPSVAGVQVKKCGETHCYTGGVELCKTSYDSSKRAFPEPSIGNILNSSQYYDINSIGTNGISNQNYDKNVFVLRNKTPIEMGMCIELDTLFCDEEINHPEGYTKNIFLGNSERISPNWPKTEVGLEAQGVCISGWKPSDETIPLKRYCVYQSKTKAKFEDNNQKCKPD